jgi:hypothetical protein
MKNDEILISKLIEETCTDENSENLNSGPTTKPSEDLSSYFERRVNQVEYLSLAKYIFDQSLNAIELKFNNPTKCFKMKIGNIELDFPSNWSVFSNISTTEVIYVNRENDTEFLCDILTEISDHCESFMLVNDKNEVNLITFNDYSGQLHFEWMKAYFEKRNLKVDKIAA